MTTETAVKRQQKDSNNTNKKSSQPRTRKQNANTVFFRYSPSNDPSITRKHFESFFSDVCPVKKCSLIRENKSAKKADEEQQEAEEKKGREAKGFGFCKFTSQEDAITCAKTLNETYMELDYGRRVKVWVELADAAVDKLQTQAGKRREQEKQKLPKEKEVQLPPGTPASDAKTSSTEDLLLQLQSKKRTSRVIIRNLSFYATENNIRQVMEERFGPVVEINLPLVPNANNNNDEEESGNKRKRKVNKQHRGFAFVTFANPNSAQMAVNACASSKKEDQVQIKKRAVAIDLSVPKVQHQRMMEEEKEKENQKAGDESSSDSDDDDDDDNDDDSSSSDSEGDNEDSDNSKGDSSDDDDDDGSSSESEEEAESEGPDGQVDKANTVQSNERPKHSLFLRNLPFDVTRHDLFTTFSKHGHIAGIYLVKDKVTGINRGTAFVNFSNEGGCMRALEAGQSGNSSTEDAEGFKIGKNMMQDSSGGGGIYLHGRRILVDEAVDKSTAKTLAVERDEDGKPVEKKIGKDRRNLYLKGEGRVENVNDEGSVPASDAWENIPESDQQKRGRAHQDKSTKLRSPLFFINPYRLSIKNLSKQVDEAQFKALIVTGIKKGLENELVTRDDVSAHWRATGEMSTRDILMKMKELEKGEENKGFESTDKVIPPFDDKKGIKKYIPSVYIDRDFEASSRGTTTVTTPTTDDDGAERKSPKVKAPSRGFAFVEFTEHAHALACLRELNNNTAYSAEYVAGGKKAIETKRNTIKNRNKKKSRGAKMVEDDGTNAADFIGDDGKVRIPRLIVEFTVENKAKARKQAERRALQQANIVKQKESHKKTVKDNAEGKKKKKQSRGALQRERKRKLKEEGLAVKDNEKDEVTQNRNQMKSNRQERETNKEQEAVTKKPQKPIKPRKKQKTDKDEVAFEDMVRSYKEAFSGGGKSSEAKEKPVNSKAKVPTKRWFD